MLQAILLDVKERLKNYYLFKKNEKKLDDFINMLKFYNPGEVLFPRAVKLELSIGTEEAYDLLTELVKMDYLEINYKIVCTHSADMPNGDTYRNIQEIPLETCNECEEGCKLLNNIAVIFRVKKWKEI